MKILFQHRSISGCLFLKPIYLNTFSENPCDDKLSLRLQISELDVCIKLYYPLNRVFVCVCVCGGVLV